MLICEGVLFFHIAAGGDAGAFALGFVEDDFADAEGGGCDFEVFVVSDVFHGFFEGKFDGGVVVLLSSALLLRMLVRFLLVTTLITMSLPGRRLSPMTSPL